MKKIILILTIIAMATNINAQNKFDVKDFGSFKLHSYASADAMGDMTYIIEGKNSVVVLEPAAFFDNIKEFGEYVTRLNKPVEKVIANYHTAGFSAFDHSKFVMIEGMPEFVRGDIYKGMMDNFAAGFGNAIDVSDFVPESTVGINSSENWAGVEFKFFPGASSDFPAASVLIGAKVYYMHFTPVANMHMGPLQIINREAVDATLAELNHAKKTGVLTFIGGHGMGTSDINALDFQIQYLEKVKENLSKNNSADEFIAAMKSVYQNIAGEDDLLAVAANLYK